MIGKVHWHHESVAAAGDPRTAVGAPRALDDPARPWQPLETAPVGPTIELRSEGRWEGAHFQRLDETNWLYLRPPVWVRDEFEIAPHPASLPTHWRAL